MNINRNITSENSMELRYRMLFKSREHQEQALLEYNEEQKTNKPIDNKSSGLTPHKFIATI